MEQTGTRQSWAQTRKGDLINVELRDGSVIVNAHVRGRGSLMMQLDTPDGYREVTKSCARQIRTVPTEKALDDADPFAAFGPFTD